jgi:hypothetical protein
MPDGKKVIAGSGAVYIAAETVAIPTLTGSVNNFSAFTEVGYTEDGIESDYSATDFEVRVDEESYPVDVLIDKETSSLSFKMAETSMQNLYYAITGATFTGGDTVTFGGKAKPDIFRVGFIGPGSDGPLKIRQLLLFRAYPKSAFKAHYKRSGKVVYQVQFMCLADSTQPAGSRAGIWKDS